MSTLRLPRNKAEEAELHALSQEGPYPVYKWIYGPDHFFARSVKGKSWETLQVADPAAGAREILDSLKQLKRNRLDWAGFIRISFMVSAIVLFLGELVVTKFLTEHPMTLWYSTLSMTFGVSLVIFAVCASVTYGILRLSR